MGSTAEHWESVYAGAEAHSWDQDLPADQATRMLTELQKLFLGNQTPQGFVAAMAGG